MAAPKLTPWYPGTVKPARPGVYQREHAFGIRHSKWDGSVWLSYSGSPSGADMAEGPSSYQDAPWRGLAKEPKQ